MSYQQHPNSYQIFRYLSSPKPYSFWRWGESGNVILWNDGRTIAFREELIAVLEGQTDRGLPPLDCVVLLLAATRESWPRAQQQMILSSRLDQSHLDCKRAVLELLDQVHALPVQCRETVEAKTVLASLVFERFGHRLNPEASQAVLQMLTAGLDGDLLEPRLAMPINPTRLDDFRRVLAKVDAGSLELRIKTGVDQLPGPAGDGQNLLPSQQARALVESLQEDRKLGGLARVARRLLGAVHLPHQVSEHQELPLGGVSDLTNRGELDRLLLSELAYDDMTLAVRVALNEALYLRRESPPRTPPNARALLIDTGIRMWGIPRVFAAAVGLALVASSDTLKRVSSFHPQGSRVAPIELTTRAGLVAHLEALEPDPHPGAALGQFLEASAKDRGPVDSVVITDEEVARDAEFQRALANLSAPALFLATVSRHGRFRLELCGPHGSRLIRAAELDLEKLFASPPRPRTPLVDGSLYPSLPHIFSVKPFPLRLSIAPRRIAQSWPVPGYGSLALARDGRLLYSDRQDWAAVQVAEHLPRIDKCYWSCQKVRKGKLHAVVGHSSNSRVYQLVIDLKEPSCRYLELVTDRRMEDVYSASAYHGALFVRNWLEVAVYQRSAGCWIETRRLPRGYHFQRAGSSVCTRFVRRAEKPGQPTTDWLALTFDGRESHWVPVTCGSGGDLPPLNCLFDWHGHDGPVGVGPKGDLFCTATGKWTRLQKRLGKNHIVEKVSSRGDRVALETWPVGRAETVLGAVPVITTETGEVTWVGEKDVNAAIEQRKLSQIESIGFNRRAFLRTSIKSIVVDQQHDLALVSRRGHLWKIVLVEWLDSGVQCNRLELRHDSYYTVFGDRCDCEQLRSTPSLRTSDIVQQHPKESYRLRVAKWRDGSRAYFDSRGLLHLVSANPKLPETTVVLYEHELSGWCADGRCWGADAYTGGQSNTSAKDIYEQVLRAFARGVVS